MLSQQNQRANVEQFWEQVEHVGGCWLEWLMTFGSASDRSGCAIFMERRWSNANKLYS